MHQKQISLLTCPFHASPDTAHSQIQQLICIDYQCNHYRCSRVKNGFAWSWEEFGKQAKVSRTLKSIWYRQTIRSLSKFWSRTKIQVSLLYKMCHPQYSLAYCTLSCRLYSVKKTNLLIGMEKIYSHILYPWKQIIWNGTIFLDKLLYTEICLICLDSNLN